jgi:uncharacterized membrane protein
MSDTLVTLTIVAAVGSGLVAGVFFAFSAFVMQALGALPPARSIAAMQAINRTAPTAWFMAAFLGTGLVSLVVGIAAIVRWGEAGATYQLIGSVLSVLPIIITAAYHVPRNDALDVVDPDNSDAARCWADYAPGWTRWNHVRTVTPLAAAVLLTLAARVG